MKNTALVSIIIPTYNQAELLVFAINSALAQDYGNLEVVVADDCSDGETEKIVQGIDDPRLRYFRNTSNLGRVGNYRKALYEYARGDWVLNLDGDDLLLDRSYIRAAVEAAQAVEDTVIVCADRHVMDFPPSPNSYKNRVYGSRPEYMDGTEYLLSLPRPRWRIHHLTTLYNRQAALQADFYRSDIISADYESIYRLIIGHKIAYFDEKVAIWRRHKQNASRTLSLEDRKNNFMLYTSVRDYAESCTPALNLDQWLIRNIARRYYSSILYQLADGTFNSLTQLSAFIKAKYPQSYVLVWHSPKTYVQACFFLCKYVFRRLTGRLKKA